MPTPRRHRQVAADLGVVAGRRRRRLLGGGFRCCLQFVDLRVGEVAHLDLGVGLVGVLFPQRARLLLLGVAGDLDRLGVVCLQEPAVGELGDRDREELVGEIHDRDQVGDDQDDVLRHLGPRDRLHAAKHRAEQHADQADENADVEIVSR